MSRQDEHEPTQRPAPSIPEGREQSRDTEPTTPLSLGSVASSEPTEPHTDPKPKASPRRSGEDTLLSLPAPADAAEPPPDDPRIGELERRCQQLEARLAVVEVANSQSSKSSKRWLAWIAFMVTLAVAWQIVQQFR